MAGKKEGGIKAAQTNKERHGEDFYREIGAIGGRVRGVKKGFAAHPEIARWAGSKGGKISKRGKAKKND